MQVAVYYEIKKKKIMYYLFGIINLVFLLNKTLLNLVDYLLCSIDLYTLLIMPLLIHLLLKNGYLKLFKKNPFLKLKILFGGMYNK